jgi:phosphate-selective porin OprO and OprP
MSVTALKRSAMLIAGAAILPGAAVAKPAPQEQVDKLRQKTQEQMHNLDQQIRILNRRLEIKEEEEAEAYEEGTTLSAGEDGFVIDSNDGAYELKLRGLVQGDTRIFADDEGAFDDTFTVRRARPILEGTLGDFVSFRLMPDFGGSEIQLVDAYIDVITPLQSLYNLRNTDSAGETVPLAVLRGGKFKSPVGLERLQSASWIHMIERGYPTELAPNRDIGVEVYSGDLINGKIGNPFNYAFAFTNGAPDGRDSPNINPDDDFEFSARLGAEPIDGLGFGIAGSIGNKEGGTGEDAEFFLPRYRSPGQETIFEYAETTATDGQQFRWSPQGYYYTGPFGVLAEYIQSQINVTNGVVPDHLNHKAAQGTFVYVLTGEDASYSGVDPERPVGGGGWGAWELAGRLEWLDLDDDSFPLYADPAAAVSEARTFGLGVNWYLTKNVKAALDYFQTDFNGFAGVDFPKEKVVLSRLQVSF